jgi:hypothetical protein
VVEGGPMVRGCSVERISKVPLALESGTFVGGGGSDLLKCRINVAEFYNFIFE